MLPVGWLVLAVLVAVLLTGWLTFTITRLDRLHARVEAAQAALDAQLVRRAAALAHVAETAGDALAPQEVADYERVAQRALGAGRAQRPAAENDVGHALRRLAASPGALGAGPDGLGAGSAGPGAAPGPAGPVGNGEITGELREAAVRVQIARRFYNDAVRDTRTLRARRLPRVLHLAGHRELPQFFDIDDTLPPEPLPARRQPAAGLPGRGTKGTVPDPS